MDAKHQFVIAIFQLARRWRVRLDERLKPSGLTKSGWAVVYWLSRSPEGVTQGQLAEQIGLETSTLTRQLDGMERQGWIERRSVSGDRRLKLVLLSDQGRARMQALQPVAETLREELLADISEAELEAAVKVLQRVQARFD